MDGDPNPLMSLIRKAIEDEVERIVKEETEATAKRVQERVKEKVAFIASRVLEKFTMDRYGTTLRIEVDFSPNTQYQQP